MLADNVPMSNAVDDEQRWQAVVNRDRTQDGTFVFAVRSTGIYCRPSCPARRPDQANVSFFPGPAEAETAGFRACQRCYPHLENRPEPQAETIEQICRYIEENLDAPLQLSDLSKQFHLSPYHLQRTFKRIKGLTPRQYAESRRLAHFKQELHTDTTITSALYDAGYRSSSSMYERAPAQLGMSPTVYRKGGKGMHIGYTITQTTLGYILIAATARGIAAVRFGETEASLQSEIHQEFPEARLEQDNKGLQPWVNLFQEQLEGQDVSASIPFDIQATAFQWKVWKALRTIPAGSTCSYREVAQMIGQPSAARAVARACATNPVAVFIPCHRVVRENGQLAGYRWGLERKQQLLSIEREHAAEPLASGSIRQ